MLLAGKHGSLADQRRAARLLCGVLACSVVLSGMCCGCAQWSAPSSGDEAWKLPAPKMAPDAVVLEIAFVKVTAALAKDAEAVWLDADEQQLPLDLRRQLHDNGLRCGILSVQMPVSLQHLLDQQPERSNLVTAEAERLEDDITTRQYRIQSREGTRYPLAAGKTHESLTVLINEQGAVRGETFQDAQCIFAIRTYAQKEGRVLLELVPEIEHGHPRNRRIAAEGIWRLDFSRDRKSYEALRTQALLAPGQILLMTATADGVGLGGSFFRRSPEESTMLLIRLAQTQGDNLFRADDQLQPIASSRD